MCASHAFHRSVWQRRTPPSARGQSSEPGPGLRSPAPVVISSWPGNVENGVSLKARAGGKAVAKPGNGKVGIKLDAGVVHGAM